MCNILMLMAGKTFNTVKIASFDFVEKLATEGNAVVRNVEAVTTIRSEIVLRNILLLVFS